MNSSRPLLSIGMIVKNEMRCLGRCLAALKPLREALPCELVIADTGSTDGTRALAAQHADLLFDFAWCDDFSAARNAVLDRCGGVWHLQVDADEYLDGASVSQLVMFLTSGDGEQFELGQVVQRNYKTDEMLPGDYTDTHVLRMIRMDTGSRYEGTIHESPSVEEDYRTVFLGQTVFHHDGYIGDRGKGKKERNLYLLEKELAREPGELRRLVQCLESSTDPAEKERYARMAVAAAEEGGDLHWRMAAFHDALYRMAGLRLPELPQWGEKARALFPDSILVEVGAANGLARYHYGLGEYTAACREAEAYFRAIARFDSGDFDPKEVQITSIDGVSRQDRRQLRFLQANCFGKLERWGAMAEALGQLTPDETYDGTELGNYLVCLLALWRSGEPGAEWLLRRTMKALSGEAHERFAALCRRTFGESGEEPEGRESWRLFAALGDGCDLGRFGLLMGAETKAEAERLLHGVEAPRLLPPEVLGRGLSLGAALPEGIFRMEAEEMAALAKPLAAMLAEEPQQAFGLCPDGEEPGRALWGFAFARELAGHADWPRKGSIGLFDFFCAQAERYLAVFFREALRREENWGYLPRAARFGARCGKARAARYAGDELGYVRGLRDALQDAPGMKNMVNWLLREAKERAAAAKEQAPPELLALAEQVKALLAQYPADHPAVRELRNSPLYRQVAYLIEE